MVLLPLRRFSPLAALVSAFIVVGASASQAESIAELLARALSPADKTTAKPAEIKNQTRFVIGLDSQVQYQVFSLANPNRVVVELPAVKLRLPPKIDGNPVGLVKSFRGGVAAPGQSRVVINVTEAVVVRSAKIEPAQSGKGHQLALNIVPVAAKFALARKSGKSLPKPTFSLGASGLQPPLPTRAQHPDAMASRSFKPTIVIDPGHGGHDSGAKKNGVIEKEVVLAFSKALRKKLEATGRYRVLMTRDRDVFIKLSERVNYAERNKADLFIAVHADYARSSASGATVYSLRDSVARGLRRSAKRKVASSVLTSDELKKVKKARGDISIVKSFLSDLAQREVDATGARTDVFSKSVINFMGQSTTMRSSPHKKAGFRVLKTQKFPSVLIELAYVTNKSDAQKLKSNSWRDKVSSALTEAVDSYFTQQIARFPM